jgi:hypothetical protein
MGHDLWLNDYVCGLYIYDHVLRNEIDRKMFNFTANIRQLLE